MKYKISDYNFGQPIRPMVRGGNGGRSSIEPVVYAVDICGVDGGKRSYAVRIAIRQDLADEARIRQGDYVDVVFDESAGAGLVRRVGVGEGYKMLATSKKGGRLYFKMTWRVGLATVADSVGCDASATTGSVLFKFPSSAVVSYTRNLRADVELTQ
jgi:hypothetical protein